MIKIVSSSNKKAGQLLLPDIEDNERVKKDKIKLIHK